MHAYLGYVFNKRKFTYYHKIQLANILDGNNKQFNLATHNFMSALIPLIKTPTQRMQFISLYSLFNPVVIIHIYSMKFSLTYIY